MELEKHVGPDFSRVGVAGQRQLRVALNGSDRVSFIPPRSPLVYGQYAALHGVFKEFRPRTRHRRAAVCEGYLLRGIVERLPAYLRPEMMPRVADCRGPASEDMFRRLEFRGPLGARVGDAVDVVGEDDEPDHAVRRKIRYQVLLELEIGERRVIGLGFVQDKVVLLHVEERIPRVVRQVDETVCCVFVLWGGVG